MKIGKRIGALAAALVFLCLCIPFGAVAATGYDRYGRAVLQQMDGGSRLVAAYDALVAGVETATADIAMPTGGNAITVEELETVNGAVHADYPEYFWSNGGYSCSYAPSTMQVGLVSPVYVIPGDDLAKAKKALNDKVNELTGGLNGKSDYEISKILHDRVAQSVEYGYTPNDQTAYGALVEGRAVCAGYARAYQLLMSKMGIPVWIVRGQSVNPTTGNPENHAWNMAKLDGEWYYTDVTWDDQGQKIYYAYLNQAYARMKEGHIPGLFAAYLPQSTATANNYFVKNGGLMADFDAAALAQRLRADGMTTRLYITGDKAAYVDALNNDANMKRVLTELGHPRAGYSWNMGSLGREIILTVKVVESGHKHKTQFMAEEPASCQSTGKKAYYTCDCGKWFSDADAKQEITDKESLTIPALTHTPSGWKTDNRDHWKVCSRPGCGVEIAGSRAAHMDDNKDEKCDTCGAHVPKPDGTMAPPPTTTLPPIATTTVKKTTATTKKDVATPGTTAPGTTAAENSGTDSTTTAAVISGETTTTTAVDGSVPDDGATPLEPADTTPGDKVPLSPVIIIATVGGVVVLAGGTAGLLFFLRRDKK